MKFSAGFFVPRAQNNQSRDLDKHSIGISQNYLSHMTRKIMFLLSNLAM